MSRTLGAKNVSSESRRARRGRARLKLVPSLARLEDRALPTSVGPASIITTVAGNLTGGYGGDGGPAVAAGMAIPYGVATNSAGDVFIAVPGDHVVRRVDHSTGLISRVAGNGTAGYGGDGGPATAAALNEPGGLAVDSTGNLFIADSQNHVVRAVDLSTGVITTVAGNGIAGYSGDGGPATSASLGIFIQSGLALDGSGHLLIGDSGNGVVRQVHLSTGMITTVVGSGSSGYSGDGGPATSASLIRPTGVAVAGGTLYIADGGAHVIRQVDRATGIITTVAGNGLAGYGGDGGPATSALLFFPAGVAVDGSGNLLIAEAGNPRVRMVELGTGVITTLAGNGDFGFDGDGGPASAAELALPSAVAVDASGNVYLTDNGRVREVVVSSDDVTSVTLSSNQPSGSTFGERVTLAAKVTAITPATGEPSGMVAFLEPSAEPLAPAVLLGTSALNNQGVATIRIDGLPGGTPPITAVYLGDTSFKGSLSTGFVQVVNPAPTTIRLTSSDRTSRYGQAVTFTARVKPEGAASGVPVGSVTFTGDGTPLGPDVVLDGTGTATITIATLDDVPAGHRIEATFSPFDANFLSGVSPVLVQTVNPAKTSVALESSANPSSAGAPITFTAVVSALAPGGGVPVGTVTFHEGQTILDTEILVGGMASFTTSELTVGEHRLRAVYSGDSNFQPRTSATLRQVVNSAPTALASLSAMHSVDLAISEVSKEMTDPSLVDSSAQDLPGAGRKRNQLRSHAR